MHIYTMMGKVGALEFFFAFICSLQHRDHIYSHSFKSGPGNTGSLNEETEKQVSMQQRGKHRKFTGKEPDTLTQVG